MKYLIVVFLILCTQRLLWALPPTDEVLSPCRIHLQQQTDERWTTIDADGFDEDSTTLWGALRGGNNARYIGAHRIEMSSRQRAIVKLSEDTSRSIANLVLHISWDSRGAPTVVVFRDENPAVVLGPEEFTQLAGSSFFLNRSKKMKDLKFREFVLKKYPLDMSLVTGTRHIRHVFSFRSPIVIGFFQN